MWKGKGEKTHNNFAGNSFQTYLGILTTSYLHLTFQHGIFHLTKTTVLKIGNNSTGHLDVGSEFYLKSKQL